MCILLNLGHFPDETITVEEKFSGAHNTLEPLLLFFSGRLHPLYQIRIGFEGFY